MKLFTGFKNFVGSTRKDFLFLSVLLGFGSVASASPSTECIAGSKAPFSAKVAVERVEARYKEITGISAKFEQESSFTGLDKRERAGGSLVFEKPGRMDWQYNEPTEQRFVADGETLWFFQPNENQVTVGSFKQSFQTDLPVSFLLGIGGLKNRFNTKDVCMSERGVVLTLTPKEHDPSLETFRLVLRQSDAAPLGAVIRDLGGNETEIVLEDVVLNPKIDRKRFTFEIPRGVDIIDRRGVAAAAPAVPEMPAEPKTPVQESDLLKERS